MSEQPQEQLSPEEQQLLKEALASYTPPMPEEKHNVHTFLNKVAEAEDTTKLGYLTPEETGLVRYPLRTTKELSLISRDICDDEMMSSYFNKEAEIITSASLSKDAKLITLAVIQKREIADVSKRDKPNKGWFKSKDKKEETQ